MIYKTSDFIKFDADFKGEYGDFSGENAAFNADERIEFLTKYSEFLQRKYNAENSRKVISEERIKSARNITAGKNVLPAVRKRTVFEKAFIYKSDAFSEYEKIALYGGAEVKDGAMIFKDKPVPPTPSCLLKFGEDIRKISFSVKIDDDYLSEAAKSGVRQKPLVTTVGKTIYFRNGVVEIAEVKFYDNGGVYARVAKRDFYHHDFVYLGDYCTDRDNEIACEFGENSYSIVLNGTRTENIGYTNDLPVQRQSRQSPLA